MLFIHEIHSIAGGDGERYEALLRDRWAPALARQDGVRLAWCARSMAGAIAYPELITLTAVADPDAFERLTQRIRSGDLHDEYQGLEDVGTHVTTRLVKSLAFSPLTVDVAELPDVPVDTGRTEMFMHDTVPPRPGMQRTYEKAMGDFFMKMIDVEGIPIKIWAGLETVTGGGTVPENLMISHIGSAAAGAGLLMLEPPRSAFEPGQWMAEALTLRDTWTSRLIRTVSWSPIH